MLACATSEELVQLKVESEYNESQIDWVYENALNNAEKAHIEMINRISQPTLDFSVETPNLNSGSQESVDSSLKVGDRRYCPSLKESGIVTAMDNNGEIIITYEKSGVIPYLNLESVLKQTVG